jgi:hypothetical protein
LDDELTGVDEAFTLDDELDVEVEALVLVAAVDAETEVGVEFEVLADDDDAPGIV